MGPEFRNIFRILFICLLVPQTFAAAEPTQPTKDCHTTISIHLERVFNRCVDGSRTCPPPIENIRLETVVQPEGCNPRLPKVQAIDQLECSDEPEPTCKAPDSQQIQEKSEGKGSDNAESETTTTPKKIYIDCDDGPALLSELASQCIGEIPKPQSIGQGPFGQTIFDLKKFKRIELELAGNVCPDPTLPTPTLCNIHERFERDPPIARKFKSSGDITLFNKNSETGIAVGFSRALSDQWSLRAYLGHSDDDTTTLMFSPMFYILQRDRVEGFVRFGFGLAELAPTLRFEGGDVPALEDELSFTAEFAVGLDLDLSSSFFIRPEVGVNYLRETGETDFVGMLSFGWRCGMP